MCMCVPSCPVSTHSPYMEESPKPHRTHFTFIMAAVTGSRVACLQNCSKLKAKVRCFWGAILLSGGENSQYPVSVA